MNIDRDSRGASPPAGEWCVRTSISVIRIVPPHIRKAWEACEAFQRGNAYFWPDNRALTVPMGVGHVRSVQRLLTQLEDLGILERRAAAGNRRSLALLRRIADPITPGEWSAMEERAESRQRERASTSKNPWLGMT